MELIRPLALATLLLVSGAPERGDKSRQQTPGLTGADRQQVSARDRPLAGDVAGSPQLPAADALVQARAFEAIQLEVLKQRQAEKALTLRELSNLQARHHETMMQIIRNLGPSGRYEYNPATGRYDRYVPNPRR